MDELMLMEYLKSKGMEDMSEQEFVYKFKEFMRKHGGTSYMRYHENMGNYPDDSIKYRRRGGYMRKNQGDYPYIDNPEFPMNNAHLRDYGQSYSRFNRKHGNMDGYLMDMNTMGFNEEEHFDEPFAKYTVSNMSHMESGRKYAGEKFSMNKAREVLEKYKGMLPPDITAADVYVAINAQYHDYCVLFKSWFGNDIDHKVIESAIIFWFKDVDYDKGFKLMEYFKD